MLTTIAKIFNALLDHFDGVEQRRREAYLAESSNIYELEYRMRQLDHAQKSQGHYEY